MVRAEPTISGFAMLAGVARPHALIVTPAAPRLRTGNRRTALRWMHILRDLGWRAEIETVWAGPSRDLLVALHALKSHSAIALARERSPRMPIVLALTGTDLYRDIRTEAEARASLAAADRLVVLQEEGPKELPPALRARTQVIYQSERARAAREPPGRVFRICVLGHLRAEKDPLRMARALARLPAKPCVEVVQAGAALDASLAGEARAVMVREPRYRWLGELPHWKALRLLASSHVMVISSRMEGGAHVVGEAIAHGVPVIASDIPGNRGMLGPDYPGYFPPGDEDALAAAALRAMRDPEWLARLTRAVQARAPLFDPRTETLRWSALLAGLGLPARPGALSPGSMR
ncbi:MAG: hypothetical protein Fur0039_13370 [Rhodocyclaceae bacterium]